MVITFFTLHASNTFITAEIYHLAYVMSPKSHSRIDRTVLVFLLSLYMGVWGAQYPARSGPCSPPRLEWVRKSN